MNAAARPDAASGSAASRRRSVAEIAISATLLALGVAVAIGSRGLAGNTGYAQVGPDRMPLLVGIGLAINGGWLLYHALTRDGWRMAEPDDAEARGDHPFLVGAFLWVLGGMAAQMLLMPTGGFVIAAAALFACVCRGFGSTRWLRDLAIGVTIGIAVYLFFVRFLNVALPAGILQPILGTTGL